MWISRKNLKNFILLALLIITIPLFSLAAARQSLLQFGKYKTTELLSEIPEENELSVLKHLTQWSHSQFRKNTGENNPAIYRIIPYVSNRRLPEIIRVPPGAIEFLFGDGICDSAARTLGFMLATLNIDAKQTNIVTSTQGHTGLSVFLKSGVEIFVDPLFAFLAHNGESPLSIHQLKDAFSSGARPDAVLMALGPSVQDEFYRSWDDQTAIGYQGEGMTLDFLIPPIDRPIRLGDPDDSSIDVTIAGKQSRISGFFTYIGSRYDRSWVRILRAQNPITIRFVLIGDVDENLLVTDPEPIIEGNTVSWRLSENSPLILYDKNTPLQLRANRNYQYIDYIEIAPLSPEFTKREN